MPRSYKVTSTVTATAIANYDTTAPFNHVSVTNNTDGVIEIYFNDPNTNLIILKGFAIAFDFFTAKGQAYIRNITGTGGEVAIVLWASEGH